VETGRPEITSPQAATRTAAALKAGDDYPGVAFA
jgi:hypothetical protein